MKVGTKVPMILPIVLEAFNIPTVLPLSSKSSTVYFTNDGGTVPNKNNGNTKEPLEWIVLEKSNGKALILSKYSIESVKYNNENTGITWEECTLRKWLNSDFMNIAFTDAEKQKIISIS